MSPTLESSSAPPRRLFIVGTPRSGTTLLQSLLAAHPAIISFTESHYFSRHFRRTRFSERAFLLRSPVERLREFIAENGADPQAFEPLFSLLRGPRMALPFRTRQAVEVFFRILDTLTATAGGSVWLEKTPKHLHYIELIEGTRRSPREVRFIHIVRDGRDVVASMYRAAQHWKAAYSVNTCVERWNNDLRITLRRASTTADLIVFYDDLVTDPEKVMRSLLGKLEVSWDPRVLTERATAAQRVTAPDEVWKANTTREIERASSFERTFDPAVREHVVRLLHSDQYLRLRNLAYGSESRG